VLKTIVLMGLGALAFSPVAAAAQSGYGISNSGPSTSTFDRAWNHANESKERARAGAAYVRHLSRPGYHYSHHQR
jgi:hypothetical protein